MGLIIGQSIGRAALLITGKARVYVSLKYKATKPNFIIGRKCFAY